MRTGPCLVISLVGMSCASPPRGPGGASVAGTSPDGHGHGPVLVGRSTLGGLSVGHWRLPNGLEVILAPDPSASSVSYTTWYRVGSRHEDAAAGETGLAHLFEHLMFTQTEGASETGDFDRLMEEVGGHTNAMTYYDFTAYIDDIPPPALPLTVRLEAERMVRLALRPEQVETEREVVAEERLASVEDSVDGMLDEIMHAQAFKRHPYRLPVIGLMKDIKAATPEKALRFYRAFYAPNNAVIVAAGRLEEAAVLSAIVEHYSPLPASKALPRDESVPEQAPTAVTRVEISRPVLADRLVVGYGAPPLGAEDRAAFEVLAEVLAGGRSSRLYRRLVVEDPLASSVTGSVPPTKDPGLFSVWVQLTHGRRAAEAEAVIEEEVGRLRAQSISPEELARAKIQQETGFWRGLGSSQGKAERLGEFAVSAGDHRKLFARAEEYARVSHEDVRRTAERYLGGGRSVVVARGKAE